MKIRRILLVSPPAYTFKTYRDINPLPPMGLGYLASVAENLGIEVKILDCLVEGWDIEEQVNDELIKVGISDQAIKAHIDNFDPDVVGINCQFSRQHRVYHQLLTLIKETRPDCITIGGGAHVTVCPDDIINDLNCDFAIIGEAEESFRDLLQCLSNDSDFSLIDGLCFKIDGKAYINKKQKWISDLDSLPFPAFHLMNLEKYFGLPASHGLRHRQRFMPIMTSRGCPAKCTFCSAKRVWGNKFRVRSVENVIEEMKLLRNEYGVEELMFEDDNATANSIRAKKLFTRMIQENLGFIWDTPNGVGVWSIDEEILDLMKESGCVKLNFPVESGSQEVLDTIIKKPLELSKIPRLIEHCRDIKLAYGMFLVIGMPREKIEDMWKSFRFAADCGCFAPHMSVATPYPGTELFDICMENSLFTKEFSLDDLFIRSFMIETSDWDEHRLRKTLLKGKIYLKYRQLISDWRSFFEFLFSAIKRPRYYLTLIQDLIR
jgi:anaerobic magnesium-protoporphyrin IX monomethyl ester cyclase